MTIFGGTHGYPIFRQPQMIRIVGSPLVLVSSAANLKKNATSKRHAAQETTLTWTKSNPSNNKAYSFEDLFVPYHLGWSLEPHDRSQSNQITQKHRELVRRYGKCLLWRIGLTQVIATLQKIKKGHRTKIHSADLYTFHYFSIFFGISIIQTDGRRS